MKGILFAAALLLLIPSLSAFAGERTLEFKWAQPEPAGHPWTDIGEEICKEIDRRSGGRIKITQYPAGQLGSHLELVEMLRTGSVAFHTSGPAALNAFDERVQIFNIPYLIKSKEQAYRIYEAEVGQKMFNDVILKRSGIRTLQFWYFGTRTLTLNRPVSKPEDLAGDKVRCMEMPIFKDAISSLGANPTPITFSELYLALQTRVVDGQENPIPTIYAQKFYEVQPYIILTNHTVHMGTVHISEMVWQRLF
ncbi:MAG: TRAP transporter substrate-binding protein, partial [Planctomycetota bacterium]|nr:TRAP transporter substrate-binding protein [Planctomycetota bacterium]